MPVDLLNMNTVRIIPTKVDVDRLIAAFGVPESGTKITYADISKTIGYEKDTFRWRTVTEAWRKKLYSHHNILFEAIRNDGFLCLNPNERIGWSVRKVATGKKSMMKGVNVCQSTDLNSLDDNNKELWRHISHIPNRLKMAELTESKEVPY